MVGAGLGVASTAFLVRLAGGAGALLTGQETAGVLMAAVHTGAGGHQLAVRGQGHPSFRRVAGEGGAGGDEAIGHQALGQAVGTLH